MSLRIARILGWVSAGVSLLVACLLAVMAAAIRNLARNHLLPNSSLFSKWRMGSKSTDSDQGDIALYGDAARQSVHIKSVVRQRLADKHHTTRD